MNNLKIHSSGTGSLIRYWYLIILLLLLPSISAFGQRLKDIDILVECVEYIGNDKYVANFGYNNPNTKDVSVPEPNSTIILNSGQQKKALNLFKPGRQYNVFQIEFTSKDRVLWHVILPTGTVKDVTASINSVHCSGKGNIFSLLSSSAKW